MSSNTKIFQEDLNKISIIIPIHNESLAIQKNLINIIDSFKEIISDYEIIIVESGSTDNSRELLRQINKKNIYRIVNEKNRNGWGSAIKIGIAHSKYNRVCFFPVDNQYSAVETASIINNFKGNIITYRKKSKTSLYRKLQSKIFKKLIQLYLKLDFIDINSLKIISKKDFYNYRSFSDDWGIDQDILIIIQKNKLIYQEVGINIHQRNIGESKVNIMDIFNLFFSIFKK